MIRIGRLEQGLAAVRTRIQKHGIALLKIRQITGMRACGVLQLVLLHEGIEVTAGRLEVWRLAFADRMDMHSMGPWWELCDLQPNGDAGVPLGEGRAPDLLSLRIM